MSVDKVLELAKTIVTIQMTLPQSKQTINRTMLMKRHQRIAPLFADEFWREKIREMKSFISLVFAAKIVVGMPVEKFFPTSSHIGRTSRPIRLTNAMAVCCHLLSRAGRAGKKDGGPLLTQ